MPPRTIEEIIELDTDGLLATKRKTKQTTAEQRVIAIINEANSFYETHGRLPKDPSPDDDLSEASIVIKLKHLTGPDMDIAREHDACGFFEASQQSVEDTEAPPVSLEALLNDPLFSEGNIFEMKHVAAVGSDIREGANIIGRREPCRDFSRYSSAFQSVSDDIDKGIRKVRQFDADYPDEGDFFILNGVTVYIAELEDFYFEDNGKMNARARFIFENGTESRGLLRSLQRSLYDDPRARFITRRNFGYIYVVSSLSDNPQISRHDGMLYKIGMSTTSMKKRLAGADKSSTYLKAPVRLDKAYYLSAPEDVALSTWLKEREDKLHDFFRVVWADTIVPEIGRSARRPREWFFAPLDAINEAAELLWQDELHNYRYDPDLQEVVRL